MSQPLPTPERPGAVVLFDGVCNFCNGAVNFIIDRDPQRRFRFAALQSLAAAQLLGRLGRPVPVGDPETLILVEHGPDGEHVYERSTAALRIARHLRMPWPIFYAFIGVPRGLRDFFYRLVARYRYRWFGKKDACRIPTAADRERFLGA